MTGIDWNAWRRAYASMTFADQQRFYAEVAAAHPVQQNFDLASVREALDGTGVNPMDVIELGGWDGALAEAMLSRDYIRSWTNYDIANVPQVCEREGYRFELLDDYLWNQGPVWGDVFVACHTIEHMTAEQLEWLFDVLFVDYIYLQAPIGRESGENWHGYQGSHILEIGWDRIGELLAERDFHLVGPNLWGLA